MPRGVPQEHFDEVVTHEQLREVLPRAHYLVLACPLTAETEGMLNAKTIALLPRGAYVINVARGRLIDEGALVSAVDSGHLDGGFLDAHSEEPLAPTHPYWTTPGVTVIPHDSHSSPFIGDNMVDLFCDNLSRYVEGHPLRNVVDRSRGY